MILPLEKGRLGGGHDSSGDCGVQWPVLDPQRKTYRPEVGLVVSSSDDRAKKSGSLGSGLHYQFVGAKDVYFQQTQWRP